MATKRDRKTAFPFIKPKGSIKKDVQQYRKAVMNQNGTGGGNEPNGALSEDQRDGLVNPVQRRESSASRFLKHFTRLDRSNPAYHSEGKGLRKRRNWNSERQLAVQAQQTGGDVSTAPDGGLKQQQHQQPSRNNNQPQRSHSFSEKPADHHQVSVPPSSKENSGGVRESLRWRFSGNKSSSSSKASAASDSPAKGGDTVRNRQPAAVSRTRSEGPPVPPPSSAQEKNHRTPAWISQSSGDLLIQQQQHQQRPAPAEQLIYNNPRHSFLEADYVNFEVFASVTALKPEPDLIRNLPYQQQQQEPRYYPAHRRHSHHSGFGEVTDGYRPHGGGRAPPLVGHHRTMQPSSCYGRPPAPLPPQSPPQSPQPLLGIIPHQQQHLQSQTSLAVPPWKGGGSEGEDPLEDENEETHYASQLRSSMAALFQATGGQQQQHIRQSSNSSSTYSSYSDEFGGSRADPAAAATAQQVAQQLGLPAPHYGGHHSPSSPPPPPPPVRDASSLKYVKYGPGHEKHPSWPMPASSGGSSSGATGTATGQSQRSKSWTEQTDYPKEPPAVYARPGATASNSSRSGSLGGGGNPPGYSQQLKTVLESCESRIPPEVYEGSHNNHHALVVGGGRYLPTYDCDGRNIDDKDYAIPSPPERDIAVIGPTEGFNGVRGMTSSSLTSSTEMLGSTDYVKYDDMQQYSNSSEGYSSYVPSESSYVSCMSGGTPLLDQLRRDGSSAPEQPPGASALLKEGARDSVSTVVTHSSGSNSSNETLRWHGSYSDLSSVASGGSRGMRPDTAVADPSALVVHSAKVQPPQRHNSESVLYYEQHHLSSGQKTINRQGGWSQRVERKNQWNAQQPSLPEEPAGSTDAPLSVAERIHQLEWHAGSAASSAAASSRSVPNLAPPPPQRSVSIDSALTASSVGGTDSSGQQQPKYTFLDPDKRMKVADPTLKAIQKQALLSYYERHAGKSSTSAGGPPKSPPKNDGQQGVPSSSSPPLVEQLGCDVQQVAEAQQPSRTITRCSPDASGPLIPPERPPKKPHLRSSAGPILQATPAVVLENHQEDLPALTKPAVIPPAVAKRKPPAPDPAHLRSDSPDLPPPPPPLVLPAGAEDGGDEGTSVDDEDQLPLPPPPIALDGPGIVDGRAQSPPVISPSPMYHKESSSNRKPAALLSPVINSLSHPRRSVDNHLNAAASPSPPPPQSKEVQVQEPAKFASSSLQSARSNYLRQVSEGRAYSRTDPGPPRSLLELNRSVSVQHQRSHSDGNSNGVNGGESAPVAAPFKPLPPLPPPPAARPKRPEELECDELSQDLMNHLPADSKLHALLSVPDPANAAHSLRTEGLLQVQLSEAVPQTAVTAMTASTTSLFPTQSSPPLSLNASPIKSSSCAPLPATSAYFTTSEPRAKLLNRYHSNQNILLDESEKGNAPAESRIEQPVDSELLVKKKEELVARMARKLDVLRSEREAIQEEVEANELLGRTVTSRVASVATPAEANKVFLHVAEVDKITVLLLALAGRLARAQNALQSLPADAEPQEKVVLEGKRDKLLEQLEEAKRLKENIDRRSRRVSLLLSKYLSEEEFADYSHFVTMKTKLVIDQREIEEKIKLGDEQLVALRETLHVRPNRVV